MADMHKNEELIDDEMIEYVSILAKLSINDEEKEQVKSDMVKMLDYVDTLNELDTENVEPLSHLFDSENVFREDEVTNENGIEQTLANAPKIKENMIVVPKTI